VGNVSNRAMDLEAAMSNRADSMGATYGYTSDDHEYKMPTPGAWVASRPPDQDFFKGRGEWAEDKEEKLRDALLPRVDPTGSDIWPLERASESTAQIAFEHSDAVEAHHMSEDKPVQSHMLRDAIQNMQDDIARITSDAVERQIKQFSPCEEAKVGLPHDPIDVPFPVQQYILDELIGQRVHEIGFLIDDYYEQTCAMAQQRFHEGYKTWGSRMYGWSAEERLRNVLEELADAAVYLTGGPIK